MSARRPSPSLQLESQMAAELFELRRLVHALLENDPNDMAADGVTVLDVWRKEARRILDEFKP
jgi:hypothetical protein